MKKIAIIGAGISGLYIANLLRQNPNYEITVYEKKICDLDISAFNTNEAKYTTLQRFTLINFLKGLVPDNVINFNKKVTQINYETKNIKVIFENDTSIECDYLIISDGTFSKTKSLIANKKINPKYFNSIALRATVNKDNLKEINPATS